MATPVKTPEQEAAKGRVVRDKVVHDLEAKLKQAQEIAGTMAESEFLAEVLQLESDIREVHTLWQKTGDLSDQIAEVNVTASNVAKNAQDELDRII